MREVKEINQDYVNACALIGDKQFRIERLSKEIFELKNKLEELHKEALNIEKENVEVHKQN
jgi:methionine synthase I (cobalamin-dependent)